MKILLFFNPKNYFKNDVVFLEHSLIQIHYELYFLTQKNKCITCFIPRRQHWKKENLHIYMYIYFFHIKRYKLQQK